MAVRWFFYLPKNPLNKVRIFSQVNVAKILDKGHCLL